MLAQHHDAVTGTSKQHVAFDYAKRLARGLAQADGVVSSSLNALLGTSLSWHRCALNETRCAVTAPAAAAAAAPAAAAAAAAAAAPTAVTIAVANPLGQPRRELLTLPVPSARGVTVTTAAGGAVPSQVAAALTRPLRAPPNPLAAYLRPRWRRMHDPPVTETRRRSLLSTPSLASRRQVYAAGERVTNYQRRVKGAAAHVLSFTAELPPVGVATYQLKYAPKEAAAAAAAGAAAAAAAAETAASVATAAAAKKAKVAAVAEEEVEAAEEQAEVEATADDSGEDVVTLSNELLVLNFSRASGRLVAMANTAARLSVPLDQSFCFYQGAPPPLGLPPLRSPLLSATYHPPPRGPGALWSPRIQQASGAYIFRPHGETCHAVGSAKITAVIRGAVVQARG